MQHYYLAGVNDVKADDVGDDCRLAIEPAWQPAKFSDGGALSVTLPPSSVSTFVLHRNVSGE